MAENKKSFVLYADLIKSIDHLTNEEKGILFTHLLEYVNDKNPILTDRLILTAWKPIELQLKRDLIKFEEVKAKRSDAGKRSAELRALKNNEQNSTNPTSVKNVEQTSINSTDNDNDNDNDNVFKKEINKEKNDFENENIDLLEKGKKEKEKKVAPKKEKDIHTSFAHLKITFSDYDKLLELSYSGAQIKNVFEKIENYKKNTNYKSLYLTAKNWLEKEIVQHNETRTNSTNKEQYRFSTAEAIKTITSGNQWRLPKN